MKKSHETKQILGAHLSINGGYENALYEARLLDCSALQIFTKNANSWKEKEVTGIQVQKFEQARHETGICSIGSHTSYLINLASNNPLVRARSIRALRNELYRSEKLKLSHVVLHPGSHMGSGEAKGIDRIIKGLNAVLNDFSLSCPLVLLETTAGQGTSLGSRFEQLAAIMQKVSKSGQIGICLDTSHIFAAGYDIRTLETYEHTMNGFDSIIGLRNLRLFHLNDTKKALGSRVDRHEHIGRGYIGMNAFEYIMNDPRFFHIPKIIETPKENEMDRVNLELLKNLVQ